MTDRKRIQQIEQSRTWITNALLSLMKEKSFQDISISEVTEHADLSRRTFYRHYSSLEDVLEEYIMELCDEFLAAKPLPSKKDLSPYDILCNIFTFWEKHHEFLKSTKNSRLSFSPGEHIANTIYTSRAKEHPELDTPFVQYMFTFISTGLWNILVKWACEESPATPQEMARLSLEIANMIAATI